MAEKSRVRVCKMKVTLPEYGPFKATPLPGEKSNCEVVLKKINPIRGVFWRKHLED